MNSTTRTTGISAVIRSALLAATLIVPSLSHAGWMGQFSSHPFNALVIPGSHDSGTYRVSKTTVTSPDFSQIQYVPDFLQALFAQYWGQSQSLTVAQQLTAGYRYLDLRLCADGDVVYTCHGVYTAPLQEIVSDIRTYLGTSDSSSEVIVLDFNHMYGMTPELHAAVISMLNSQLGQWIASPAQFSMSSPVSAFTTAKKHLIIAYADQSTQILNSTLLWPDSVVNSPWPNVQTSSALITALSGTVRTASSNELYVHQTQLTPSAQTVEDGLLPLYPSSLRAFTSGYESTVANWIQASGMNQVANAGVILEDFVGDRIFSGVDLAQYAIIRNQQIFSSKIIVNPLTVSAPAPPPVPAKSTTSVISSVVSAVKSLLSHFF